MAELADALDLGSSGNTRAGSTPVIRTQKKTIYNDCLFYLLLSFYSTTLLLFIILHLNYKKIIYITNEPENNSPAHHFNCIKFYKR